MPLAVLVIAAGAALFWWWSQQQGTTPSVALSNVEKDLTNAQTPAPFSEPIVQVPQPFSDPQDPSPMAPAPISADKQAIVALVIAACQPVGEDPSLILGIIQTESDFDPNAHNSTDPNGGSWGLTQMSLPTAGQFGYAGDGPGLFDPATNIQLCVAEFQWLRKVLASRGFTGDNSVIAAHNEGIGNALKGLPDYAYVNKVTTYRAQWAEWLAAAGGA